MVLSFSQFIGLDGPVPGCTLSSHNLSGFDILEVGQRFGLHGASDVSDIEALYDGSSPVPFTAVSQSEVFAFDDLGIPIDNIEGMTFGPTLPDGRMTLVIVSDNNFGAGKFTQFIVLAVDIGSAGWVSACRRWRTGSKRGWKCPARSQCSPVS